MGLFGKLSRLVVARPFCQQPTPTFGFNIDEIEILGSCRFAETASIRDVCITGYRRCARDAEAEIHTARFVLDDINRAGSADSASIQIALAASTYR